MASINASNCATKSPIEALRAATLGAQALPWTALALHAAAGALLCALGLALMQRLQKGFADVL